MLPRRKLLSPVVLIVLAGLGAACDSGASSPTSPTTPGVLQISALRTVLRAGETMPLTASSGATPATGVSWTSTDHSVATVSAGGIVTAGRPGRATVGAGSPLGSGTIVLRVVPDFAGAWSGSMARTQVMCAGSSTAQICAPGAPIGGSVTLVVVQTGDQVTATLVDSAEPNTTVPLTGQILEGDQLALAGRIDVPAIAPTLRVDVSTLRATFDPTLGTITGGYVLSVDRANTAGALQVDYRAQVELRDLPRR